MGRTLAVDAGNRNCGCDPGVAYMSTYRVSRFFRIFDTDTLGESGSVVLSCFCSMAGGESPAT